jgi:hypothetical protein
VETRLPILYTNGIVEGRITVNDFVGVDLDQSRQNVRALPTEGVDRPGI